MKKYALGIALFVCACSTEQPAPAVPEQPAEVLPAGLCGFQPYLWSACEDVPTPRFAAVTVERSDHGPEAARALERSLRTAAEWGLPPGYPFVVSHDDLPRADQRRGIATVVGLFATRPAAEAFVRQRAPVASVVELLAVERGYSACAGAEDYERCNASSPVVVQLRQRAPAHREADIKAVDEELSELPWVSFDRALEQKRERLAKLEPACMVDEGRVFISDRNRLYDTFRSHAPVRCENGEEAWVSWQATRLESVVRTTSGVPTLHQVILVECDSATLAQSPLRSPPSDEPVLLAGGGCGG